MPQGHSECWLWTLRGPASKFCTCFARLRLTHSRPLRLACLSHQRTACTLLSGPCCSAAKDECLRPSPASCRSTWHNTRGSFTFAHEVAGLMDSSGWHSYWAPAFRKRASNRASWIHRLGKFLVDLRELWRISWILPIQEHGISLHLFVSSLISFISVLEFSAYRSFVSLDKFIPRYFILFLQW